MSAKSFGKLVGGGILCGAVYVAMYVASLSLCMALLFLPHYSGLDDFVFRQVRESESLWVLPLWLATLFFELFFPFYAARWFYRFCDRFAIRFFALDFTDDLRSTDAGAKHA